MGHMEGMSRDQSALMAPSLDELVVADHPVRVVDAFVDTLDLSALGFSKVFAEETGRPAYHPGDLMKLYLYGYANGVRSSRRLEREAKRNIEVQWLINRLSPSFKTIADFRKDHPEGIVCVTRAFVQFCRGQSLYGGELVAIDGTKIEAVASRKKVITPKKLEQRMEALDRKIAEHLRAMDEADRQEDVQEPPMDVAAALAALREQREAVAAQAKALVEEGLSQRVIGEQDARLMKTARHGYQVAYNAQTAVDAQHGLIAAFELTNESNDQRLLLPMAESAKQALGAEALTVAADSGYSNGEHGLACEAAGIKAVVPRAETVNPKNPEFFTRQAFTYNPASDNFTCPAGETLSVICVSRTEQKKYYATRACAGCALKPACTKAPRRQIARGFHEDAKDAMHQRALSNPAYMKKRRCLAEHPFGTMKHWMGYPRLLLRGLKKARAEFALDVLAFNLRRVITILGVPTLLTKLNAA
jgi:transposase